ncbi:hypothetical protein ASG17_11530 [Brevundimonas sp. Leaf363]|uniref:hypothetical protein n=1 Tax=Brevundimonas sp. Leaf363 TaxID=1736353 RepID=UPI000716236D|nr:hypothetical protein [Brevundimonas sp. Leaf363]KQS54273.1 hypothetical protein ASG17_11530 [Brevundimonas sp. Leaf363]
MLTGDSHVVALGRGLVQLKREGLVGLPRVAAAKLYSFPQSLRPFFRFDGTRIAFDRPDYSAVMKQLTGSETIGPEHRDLTFALVMGFTTTLFVRMKDWDNYAPWRLAKQSGRTPLSDGLVAEIARSHFAQTLDFYRAMMALDLNVLAVEAPQVRGDDPAFATVMQRRIVLELDRLARSAVLGELRDMGVKVVPALDDARAKTGFLKEEYSSFTTGDYHHANHRFGRNMLAEIFAAIGQPIGSAKQAFEAD